jgi:hypothetical protein
MCAEPLANRRLQSAKQLIAAYIIPLRVRHT